MLRIATAPLALALVVAGCAGREEEAFDAAPARRPPLVAGLGADLGLGVTTVRLEATSAGGFAYEETFAVAALPRRVELDLPAGDEVSFVVEGHAEERRVIVRRASVEVPDDGGLIPLWLTDECLPTGGPLGRDRDCPGQTCAAGRCVPIAVDPTTLAPADAPWPHARDECGASLDEPRITLGRDGAPFTPLQEGAELVPERGLQGASHLWLAVEVEGASATGTWTWLAGEVVGTGQLGSFQASAPGYEVEDDVCHRHPVRYVLPFSGAFEQTLRLTAVAVDPSGRAGSSSVEVYVTAPP